MDKAEACAKQRVGLVCLFSFCKVFKEMAEIYSAGVHKVAAVVEAEVPDREVKVMRQRRVRH